jgi:hypothetical protein
MSIELAPATAGARTKGDIFFEVATVVEEIEAGATDALDGVFTSEGDNHRWGLPAFSLVGGGEPSRGQSEANVRIEGSQFALDFLRRCLSGDSIEDKPSPSLTDERASEREPVRLESLL